MGNKLLECIENIKFIDVNDLFDKIDFIKAKFMLLTPSYKEIYKYYFFYQLCLVRESKDNALKSIFWDYINGEGSRKDVEVSYSMFQEKVRNLTRN